MNIVTKQRQSILYLNAIFKPFIYICAISDSESFTRKYNVPGNLTLSDFLFIYMCVSVYVKF